MPFTSEILTHHKLRALAAVVLLASCAVIATPAADIVILKDGTVLRGKMFKEKESVTDKLGQIRVTMDKARGLEGMNDTVKYVFFGTHSRQVGDKTTDEPNKYEPEKFFRETRVKSSNPLPSGFGEIRTKPWDEKWKRTLEIKLGSGFDQVEQAVTYIDANYVNVVSTTHKLRQGYYTREWSPKEILDLLSNFPDLKEEANKPDVMKRLRKITFLKDVGKTQADWLLLAINQLEQLKKDIPQPWPKEATLRADVLKAEIDKVAGAIRVLEMEKAIQSGRYNEAKRIAGTYVASTSEATDTVKFTALKAQMETVLGKADQARELLKTNIELLTNWDKAAAHMAVAGAAGWQLYPKPNITAEVASVVAGAQRVLAELHSDSITRLDLFISLAAQTEVQRKAGEAPQVKPENLLALAVTGWLKGKNGADQSLTTAANAWAAREMLMTYCQEDTQNRRSAALKAYQARGGIVPFDELAQIISLLPPMDAEDLEKPKGILLPEATSGLKNIRKYTVAPSTDLPKGVEYLVKLPEEYHHGRQYPVMIVLSHTTVPPEQAIGRLAYEANRHGVILAAPVWVTPFNAKEPYDYSGKLHSLVLATRRDLLSKFNVDSDKVSLFGFAEGGSFALDVGMSHPDLFSACSTFGANPKLQNMFREYWQNAQKLPLYSVTGDINGTSFQNFYEIYVNMLQNGFPSLLVVYQGRGAEWYMAEMSPMFEWLEKQKRATGISTLRLPNLKQLEWKTMREGDNRFYWIGATELEKANILANNPVKGVFPAGVRADIRDGNLIAVEARGLKKITIYLERSMINWTVPVRVSVNSQAPSSYKAKVIEPSLEFMLDEFYKNGDRRMLFYNKLEFPAR